MFSHFRYVCCKGHCLQSNWKALTLPRTGGLATILLRSKHPFSHYAAALISRNTKIQLNGAIFSFAFGGHFSCLENFSHSDVTRGSAVIMACSLRVYGPGVHSLTDTQGQQLGFTAGNHSASHIQLCGSWPTGKIRQGLSSINNGRKFTSDCTQH